MAIFVDNAFIAASVRSGPLTHTSRWCHLLSSLPGEAGTAELLTFVAQLKLQWKYLQHAGSHREHFDLTSPKRELALKLGALELAYPAEVGALLAAKKEGREFDLASHRAAEVAATHG